MADKNIKDKELSYEELVAKRDKMKKEYMDLRFKMVISHVDNPLQKRTMRREIARSFGKSAPRHKKPPKQINRS